VNENVEPGPVVESARFRLRCRSMTRGEPDSGAGGARASTGTLEHLEYALVVAGIDPHAVVADRDPPQVESSIVAPTWILRPAAHGRGGLSR